MASKIGGSSERDRSRSTERTSGTRKPKVEEPRSSEVRGVRGSSQTSAPTGVRREPQSPTDQNSAPPLLRADVLNREPEDAPSDVDTSREVTQRQAVTSANLTGGSDLARPSLFDDLAAAEEAVSGVDSTADEMTTRETEGEEQGNHRLGFKADGSVDPSFQHLDKPEGEPESIAYSSRGESSAVYEDGTRVSEWNRDGVRHTSVQATEDDGTRRFTETFTDENGVEHTNTTVRRPDGETYRLEDAEIDGITQRRETTESQVEGAPHDILLQRDISGLYSDSVTGQKVTTKESVVGADGVSRTTGESEVITVEIPSQHENGRDFELNKDVYANDQSFALDRDITVNQEESGQTLTQEERIVYNDQGEKVDTIQSFQNQQRIVGTDSEGREVRIEEGTAQVRTENDLLGVTSSYSDHRGVHRTEDVLGGQVNGEDTQLQHHPDVAARLAEGADEYLDVRTTRIGPFQTHHEIGNYSRPTENGSTVTLSQDFSGEAPTSSGASVTLRDVSDSGREVREQTLYPGTDLTSITHSRFEDDGSYVSETEVLDGNRAIQDSSREGRVVSADEVSRDPDSGARDLFLNNVDGEIVEETSLVVSYDEDGRATTEESLNYRDSGSNANLQYTNGPDGELSAAGAGRELYAIDQDGRTIASDSQGRVFADGVLMSDGEAFSVPSIIGEPRSAISSVNRLLKANEGLFNGRNPIPQAFQNKVSALGATFATINAASELASGDVVGALEDVGDGAVSLVGGAKLLGASEIALRRLNVVGAVINGGLAVRDFNNGEYLEGGLKAGTAAGLILLAIGGPVTVPVGLAILGGIGLFEIGRYVFGDRGVDRETAPLQI